VDVLVYFLIILIPIGRLLYDYIQVCFFLIWIAAGIGLLMLKEWARKGLLLFLIAAFVFAFFVFISAGNSGRALFDQSRVWFVRQLISFVIILYLMNSKVKEQFKKEEINGSI